MATAPKVETLAESMAALNSGYSEQRGLVNEQISGLGDIYGAQKDALEGAKVKSFNSINDQAIGRGAAFSGIPLGEQADYLSDKYLPGLTNIANQENQERMTLRQQIAQLNTQQNTAAVSRIDQQQSALNAWNLQQQQLEAQAREAELQRQFTARQNALSISSQERIAAANRAASAAANAAPTIEDTVRSTMSNWSLSNKNWRTDGSSENLINSLTPIYGKAAAAAAVYGIRKSSYGK